MVSPGGVPAVFETSPENDVLRVVEAAPLTVSPAPLPPIGVVQVPLKPKSRLSDTRVR